MFKETKEKLGWIVMAKAAEVVDKQLVSRVKEFFEADMPALKTGNEAVDGLIEKLHEDLTLAKLLCKDKSSITAGELTVAYLHLYATYLDDVVEVLIDLVTRPETIEKIKEGIEEITGEASENFSEILEGLGELAKSEE